VQLSSSCKALPVAKRLVCGSGVYKHRACFHHLLQAQKSHVDDVSVLTSSTCLIVRKLAANTDTQWSPRPSPFAVFRTSSLQRCFQEDFLLKKRERQVGKPWQPPQKMVCCLDLAWKPCMHSHKSVCIVAKPFHRDTFTALAVLSWPCASSQVLRWSVELARALCFLHNCSPVIIHRDLKPANLLLNEDGHIKVCLHVSACMHVYVALTRCDLFAADKRKAYFNELKHTRSCFACSTI
jgi:serine/threonine protein kinase